MCAIPAMMGAFGKPSLGKLGALAAGGLTGLALHKGKKDKPSQRYGDGTTVDGAMSFGG